MPHINYNRREIAFKLVYFGPGMSGKTTNLSFIHRHLDRHLRSEMVSLDTDEDRTLFFDFLPLELGDIEGYAIRFNMYTVPGQVQYEASRRLILDGSDGVVFVADSRPERLDANLRSWRMMEENLRYYGRDPEQFPLALQYNKRDLDGVIPVGIIEEKLKLNGLPVLEAVATEGDGVLETVRLLSHRVIRIFDF